MTKKNTTYRPAPTKLNDETKAALIADGLCPERAAAGVGRGGRLIQINCLKCQIGAGRCDGTMDLTNLYGAHDHDGNVLVMTTKQVLKHFA